HRAVAAGRAPPAEARDEGAVLAAAPLPDRVRERSARASAIQRIVGQPEGEAAEGRIAGARVVLAHVPQRGPTGAGLDRVEQCGEVRDGQLAHQRRRGLDVDHDPLTREQGPSRVRDRGGEPRRLLLSGSPVAKWYAVRTGKRRARMAVQLATKSGSRSPLPAVAFAATRWMLGTPLTARQSTVPSQWETSIPSRRGNRHPSLPRLRVAGRL